MTFDDFIAKWSNKPVDFDGVYPNQCMDLMHQYVYDVLGITDKSVLAAPAAYQAYTGNYPQYFEKIDNTPSGVPQKGDILFFGQAVGPYGHVCIFVEGNTKAFTSFDANWPSGSLPHIQSHTYNGVLGWLHPKAPAQMIQVESSKFAELVDKSTKYDAFKAAGYTTIEDVLKKVGELTEQNTNYQKDIQTLQRQVADLGDQVKKIKDEDIALSTETIDASHARDEAQAKLDTLVKALGTPGYDEAIVRATDGEQQHSQVVKEYQDVAKELEKQSFYKRVPKKSQSLFAKLFSFFK